MEARAYFLSPEHLARLYRFANPPERHEIFVERSHLKEDGSLAISEDILKAKIENLRVLGLASYRATSSRINRLVKNESVVYNLASAFARQLAYENVLYAECRVSPLSYHCESMETLIHRISLGLKLGQAEAANNFKSIQTGILLVIERHFENNTQIGIQIAREAIQLRKKGYPIVGIDVAGGDEWNYPIGLFAPAFDIIKNYNEDPDTPEDMRIGITIHAGEVIKPDVLSAEESVRIPIELAWSPRTPVRIGHGIQIINTSKILMDAFNEFLKDPEKWQNRFSYKDIFQQSPLLKFVMEKGIVFEMCPKSNVQTFAVPYHELHPAVFLSRLGLKLSLSSDNRLISNSNSANEFVKLFKYSKANYRDMKRMILAGFDGAFIMNPTQKTLLIAKAKEQFSEIEKSHPQKILDRSLGTNNIK